MNILHLEASPGWGGQEMRILNESLGLRARGHTPFFAVARGGGLVKEARKEHILVYELSFQKSSWMITLFRLISIMRRHKIDLVNTHSSLDSWIGAIAARVCAIPVVRTRHLSTAVKSGWNSRLLYGTLADFVVTTCASILPVLSQQSQKSLAFMRSIPTGIDPEKIDRLLASEREQGLRSSLGISEDDFLVGTACFMRSWKGIHDFLEAAHLLRDHSSIRWVVIGGGHEAAYRERAKELHLEGIVFFTGHLSNPMPALRTLDAFSLLSTAHEGVSQAILQAAYLKKPLIATPVGGLQEVCVDRQTGITVPPFSPERVAEAVLTLKSQPSLCVALGKCAQELVLSRFTFTSMLDQMEEVYEQVVRIQKH